MLSGSLTYKDYDDLYNKGQIINPYFLKSQIQPSSVDLTLSEECYEINASFLSPKTNVRDKLSQIIVKKIDLNERFVFEKNKTFLVKLNESLNLQDSIFGLCNPKSTTGRLDIFCRTVLNNSDEYEKIPINYQGEMFIEITSRSFNLELQKGDSLNQMRLISVKHIYLDDSDLQKYHNENYLTLNDKNIKIQPNISCGLKVSVDLSHKNIINAYVAKHNAPNLCFQKVRFHKTSDYWNSIKTQNGTIIIEKNNFYILKSKEKIHIPKNMAGEMIPYDTGLGDFRVHYAGFFDPGFGNLNGSFAVLEVKTNEVPFLLEDGQIIARIKYEMLNKDSDVVYGADINSNYQNQSLALSKHFV